MPSLPEADDAQSLLDLSWHESCCNDRHDLADRYLRRSIAIAKRQGDRRLMARGLLGLAFNLRWYTPPDDPRVDPVFDGLGEILAEPELLIEESERADAVRGRLVEPTEYQATSEVKRAMALFRGLNEGGVADCLAFMLRFNEALALSRRIDHRPSLGQLSPHGRRPGDQFWPVECRRAAARAVQTIF